MVLLSKRFLVLITVFAAFASYANPLVLEEVNPHKVMLEIARSKISRSCLQLNLIIEGQRYVGDPCADRIQIETSEKMLNEAIEHHENLYISVSDSGFIVLDREKPAPVALPPPVAKSTSSTVR